MSVMDFSTVSLDFHFLLANSISSSNILFGTFGRLCHFLWWSWSWSCGSWWCQSSFSYCNFSLGWSTTSRTWQSQRVPGWILQCCHLGQGIFQFFGDPALHHYTEKLRQTVPPPGQPTESTSAASFWRRRPSQDNLRLGRRMEWGSPGRLLFPTMPPKNSGYPMLVNVSVGELSSPDMSWALHLFWMRWFMDTPRGPTCHHLQTWAMDLYCELPWVYGRFSAVSCHLLHRSLVWLIRFCGLQRSLWAAGVMAPSPTLPPAEAQAWQGLDWTGLYPDLRRQPQDRLDFLHKTYTVMVSWQLKKHRFILMRPMPPWAPPSHWNCAGQPFDPILVNEVVIDTGRADGPVKLGMSLGSTKP